LLTQPFFQIHFRNSWLLVGAGGDVGEGEHFPVLRSKTGEAQTVRSIVHISTGSKPAEGRGAGPLDFGQPLFAM
jgi:hypothetical protein